MRHSRRGKEVEAAVYYYQRNHAYICRRTTTMLCSPLKLKVTSGIIVHHAVAGTRRVLVEVAVIRVVVVRVVARRIAIVYMHTPT